MKRTLSAALSLLLTAASASAQVSQIGTAAAVRGAVRAVSEGAPVGRVISSGKPLFLNDHVTTDAAGRLQVLLLDETIFTLGPNSDMVLDDFVYDPKTSAGKITANIAKGTFRFVTGKVASHDPSKMKVKLAIGTIGVRGSIGVGETGPGGSTIINGGARNPDNHDDAAGIYAQGGGKTVDLIQPGVGTHIGSDGRVDDARFMTGDLNRIMGTLQPPAGKSGGAGEGSGLGGRRTATDASGRSTSVGGVLAAVTGDALGLADGQNTVVTQAVQTAANSVLTWDYIVQNVPSGTGFYFSGHAPITGSANIADANPLGAVQLYVDFGARTVGGGGAFTGPSTINGSFIHIHGVVSSIGADTIQQLIGGGGSGLNPIPFSSLTGPAVLTLDSTNLGPVTNTNGGSGSFAGTTITLQNAGGVVAKTALVNFTFSGTNSSAQSVTANGTFQAPR
ncbi:MAG: FecR domain-containing protein [Elusimicrobiota bacterium]